MAPRRKSYKQISALNLAIFSTFIMVWLFGYMKPIFSSLFEEDDLFYERQPLISQACLEIPKQSLDKRCLTSIMIKTLIFIYLSATKIETQSGSGGGMQRTNAHSFEIKAPESIKHLIRKNKHLII